MRKLKKRKLLSPVTVRLFLSLPRSRSKTERGCQSLSKREHNERQRPKRLEEGEEKRNGETLYP